MELLYKVDRSDRVLGSIERDRAHEEGILHRSGVVFLIRKDGTILIQHRSPTKKTFPDCFECSASFHVTFGETYKQAAERELREETGVSAPVRYLGKFTHFDHPENEIVAVFVARSEDKITIDKNESSSARFCPIGEVNEMATSNKAAPWFRDSWKIAKKKIAQR